MQPSTIARVPFVGLLTLFLAFSPPLYSQGLADPRDGSGAGSPDSPRVYVKFRPGVTPNERVALHAALGHSVEREFPQIDLQSIPVPPGQTADDVRSRYARHPWVEFCEPEVVQELQITPNDPWFPSWQIVLQQLGAEAAWDITTGAPEIPVAIIDTGLDYEHFEFAPRVQSGEITLHAFGVDDPFDVEGHGTFVTGVIGSLTNNEQGIAGAGWNTPVMAINGFNGFSALIDSILFATDNGARVISMSWGSYTESSPIRAALEYAHGQGVVLVAAAGNNDTEAPFYPAAWDFVIAVTGINASEIDCDYGHGPWLGLAAPCGARTTLPGFMGDSDGIGGIGGTSIGTPFVAAAAALVLSVNPELTPAQVMDVLYSTADDVGDPGFDTLFGHGRVNYHAAVLAAGDFQPPPDLHPPEVTITSPSPGVAVAGTIDVLVEAYDEAGVTHVELYLDGSFVSSDSASPHEWALDTMGLATGLHTLLAVAFDAAGNAGSSAEVIVLVDNTPPQVTLDSPGEGSTVSGTFTAEATAQDESGSLTLTLTVDDQVVGQDTLPPFTFTVDSESLSDGAHVLVVTATDEAGNSQASAPRTVMVDNGAGGGGPLTLEGHLTRQNPQASFELEAQNEGAIQVVVSFTGGGQSNTVTCQILGENQEIIASKTASSPFELSAIAAGPGSCTLRLIRNQKNANFSLDVSLP